MPRMLDELLDTVFYLYPSENDANNGTGGGGSGFFVEIMSESGIRYHYAVTNAHVIEHGSTVIGINTYEGKRAAIALGYENWIFAADKEDLAVCSVDLPTVKYKYKAISQNMFLMEDISKRLDVGIGDDICLIGRFVKHEGETKNLPSLLFGNISMMPVKVVQNNRHGNRKQESYLVDMRTISGYSGSPAFLFRWGPKFEPFTGNVTLGGSELRLLGIDWGVYPERPGLPTSVTCIVPVWTLDKLLKSEKFAIKRERKDKD